jgi:hypothetical protein
VASLVRGTAHRPGLLHPGREFTALAEQQQIDTLDETLAVLDTPLTQPTNSAVAPSQRSNHSFMA